MAGSALLTPALVLGSLRYGETSRIVRLATRDFGVVSAIAKGALRPKSRFGASLQLLSEGQAHLLQSRSSELHTLIAFDLTAVHTGLAGSLERFAAANALAELATRFVPAAANPMLYEWLLGAIGLLELAPADAVSVVGLRAMWGVMAQLGIAPTLTECSRDGQALEEGPVGFSLRDGGFLCRTCAVSGATTRLAAEDREALVALIEPGRELPLLSPAQAAAHRRLLLRWIREHLGGDGAFPALEAWQRGAPGSVSA
ncbi:MAG: DNA repair protein RecO [Gemmatimonadales bacterium]